MKALIIGATGATGKDLVNVLLKDPAYTQIAVFVRRTTGISNPKLIEVITDFNKLESVSDKITGDVWFSCLGTTLKAAGSKEKQWQIDYEIPVKFGEIAKRNSVKRLVLLSAYGATATSRIFYSSMKGKLEDALAKLAFDTYIIFRPGLLLRKDSDRFGEKVYGGILKFFNAIGLVKRFKPLPTSVLAEKLAKAGKMTSPGTIVVELEKVFDF